MRRAAFGKARPRKTAAKKKSHLPSLKFQPPQILRHNGWLVGTEGVFFKGRGFRAGLSHDGSRAGSLLQSTQKPAMGIFLSEKRPRVRSAPGVVAPANPLSADNPHGYLRRLSLKPARQRSMGLLGGEPGQHSIPRAAAFSQACRKGWSEPVHGFLPGPPGNIGGERGDRGKFHWAGEISLSAGMFASIHLGFEVESCRGGRFSAGGKVASGAQGPESRRNAREPWGGQCCGPTNGAPVGRTRVLWTAVVDFSPFIFPANTSPL